MNFSVNTDAMIPIANNSTMVLPAARKDNEKSLD